MSRPAFIVRIATRWRDLDTYNHVNNSLFLTYLEEARIAWFHSLDGPWRTAEAEPLLASAQIHFRAPIPHPALLAVRLTTARIGNSSLTLDHEIRSEHGTLHADGHTVMVWVRPDTGRPTALPDRIRHAAALLV
ncbi:MAG: acyl-CoA thioesterase [Xanthomonadales bacterium]|jgi:acyl-CoA thioester hydrolase|nr:acyl-CoA thioesterase [Xanthomonadales bacterium]